ncbi:MAG: response regulator [Candidatus Sulfotelmatobacter sp.]
MTLTARKSVLIVDDSAYIRQALCELFKREADFEVCGEAENGKAAIKKAQELRPDLIVLDLSMPVMDDESQVCVNYYETSRHRDFVCGFFKSALPSERRKERVAISEDRDSGNGLCLRSGSAGCGYVIYALDFWCGISTRICNGPAVFILHGPIHGLVVDPDNRCDKRQHFACKERRFRRSDRHCNIRQRPRACLAQQQLSAGEHYAGEQ